MNVIRTGKGIEIPTGDVTIGRILDALGDSLDGQPNITGEDIKYKDIFKLYLDEHPTLVSALRKF